MADRSHLSGDTSQMITAWTDLQRQLWRSWLDSATRRPGALSAQAWSHSLQATETLTDCLLTAQSNWARACFSATAFPLPAPWSHWRRQAQHLAEGWTMAQRAAAKAGFAAAWQLAAMRASGQADRSEDLFAAWQAAVRETWDVHDAWMEAVAAKGAARARPAEQTEIAEAPAEASRPRRAATG